jgi:predicted NUDIX family NTP pyrophosphohydrolase
MKEDHSLAAGLLMFRVKENNYEFFVTHPGGPFFKNKDTGVWSIPKGLPEPGEEILSAAIREFTEETGLVANSPYYPLGTIKQKGGKSVHAWAFSGDWDETKPIKSNTFKIEWPPKSGKQQEFPEQDAGAWCSYEVLKTKINPAQLELAARLIELDPLQIKNHRPKSDGKL